MNRCTQIFAALLLVSLLSGCGRRTQLVGTEQPGGEHAMAWQTAWVDPKIIVSDTAITLIQASRIDSVRVEIADLNSNSSTAVEFQITSPACPVEVSLLDSRNQLMRKLLSTTLQAGYYKVSLNPGVAKRLEIIPGRYGLRVVACGTTFAKKIPVS